MQTLFKNGRIILIADTAEDRAALARLVADAGGHVFALQGGGENGCSLQDIGPRAFACREPINITLSVAECWRPISNLALTPFVLHGRSYASVEGFWQGLKCDDAAERKRIAALHGGAAKHAAHSQSERTTIAYEAAVIAIGGPGHWALMRQACVAKFSQNETARTALLATGDRPLTHHVRRDSRTIPGAIMADIWMTIRARLRAERD